MTQDTNNPVVEQNNETKPADNENVVNQTADTGNETPDKVPYARFNKQVKQTKALQTQIDEMKSLMEEKKIKESDDLSELKDLSIEQASKLKIAEAKLKVIE